MAAKKFNEIKKELPLEEGKLVSDFSSVLDKIMADLKSKLGREYQKNSEKGIAMINTIGAMVGAKVTDKKQSKNRLFLKFDNDLEEKKDMTAISSWKKKIKNVKGLTKTQLQVLSNLPTPVITSLINQVGMVVAGDEPIQEDAAVDAANLKAKQAEELERLQAKHELELENLQDRHEREMERINQQKEKEVINKQIEAEREAARKANESVELEEKAPDTEDAMKRHKAGKAGFGDITHLKAKGLIPRADGTKRKSPKYEDKEEQDRDVGKNKGTQPKKYYKGLDKETKQKRDAHFKKGLTGPAPGDKDDEGNPIKTKKSTHTKKFAKMYGEKLTAKSDAGDYIDDFRKSDAPQFKGKSDKKIRKMAIAAYLSKKEK
jgi:hypothetical protein|tara:strand:+ start:993 stop:2120 length:1128 start_codon:yes stop_codon:yes gene_type:complete